MVFQLDRGHAYYAMLERRKNCINLSFLVWLALFLAGYAGAIGITITMPTQRRLDTATIVGSSTSRGGSSVCS